MKKNILALVTAGFLFCATASAQSTGRDRNPEWELSFFAGMSSLGETSSTAPVEDSTATHSSSIKPDDGVLLGARITQNLGRYFAAEMDYTFADHGGSFANPTPAVPALNMDQTTHSIYYNLLFYLRDSNSRLRPYATGGVGAALFALDGSIKSTSRELGFPMKNSWELGFRVGGGAKYRLSDKIGVRVDFADQISDAPGYGLPSRVTVTDAIPGAGYVPSGTLHNMQISAGLIYYPGRSF